MLTALVAGSGLAGLGYEVLWTRMLSPALGTEMAAALGVVAGFFGGLALGAFGLDGPIRRARRPALAYAALELVIAAWAVVSLWLLPALGQALPRWLGEAPGPALLWLSGFAAPALVLLPATAAMGGTLIALERLVAGLRHDGRVAAWVYSLNTAGAMAGALGCVMVLMPRLGLSGSLLALSAINLACAGAALLLPSAPARAAEVRRAVPARLSVTLAMTGLLGIGFEMLVLRIAAQVLQNTILSFALLLAAYLLGTALGAGWQRRRPGASCWLPGGVALGCLITAALVLTLGPWAAQTGPSSCAEWGVACALFLPATFGMGALFAALAQSVRDSRGSLGWAVGVNGLGAMAAPPLAALALASGLGAWNGLLLVACGFAALGGWRSGAAGLVAAGLLWLAPAPSLLRIPASGRLLASIEGATATASVAEGEDGTRFLEVNGHFRMGGTRSVRSDWREALIPLLLHPGPRRVLLLGVGTGATLAGAAAAGVEAAGVELTPEVIALLPWFAEPGAPRLPPVVQADARRFMAASTAHWDVIIADLFHPALDGTGALYTVQHFRAVQARLTPGGVFCQWLPLYQLQERSLRAIVRSYLDVFPAGAAWLANYSVQTPMLALCSGAGAIDAARLAWPGARAALHRAGLDTPPDVLGLRLGGAAALGSYAGDGPRNTDDRPIVALDAARNVRALSAPPSALLLQVLRGMPPGPDDGYRKARNRFIAAGAALPDGIAGLALIEAAAPGLLDAVAADPMFEPAYAPLLQMAQALAGTDLPAASALLQRIDEAAPSRTEARRLLARLHDQGGDH